MVVLGKTADTSPFCEFGFWVWEKFQDKGVTFPDNQMVLGKYLGPSIDMGPAMMQHVMKANGEYEIQSTVHQLTPKECMNPALDRVHCRKCDSNGMLVGTTHIQPAMDTHVYEVHFLYGRTKELVANTMTEAFAQCDQDGNQYIMLDAVMDFQKDPNVAISQNDQVKIVNGKKVVSCSTRGCELCCEWKDGSTSWQKLSNLKIAEFTLAVGNANEPAFNWWVTWVFKKRALIISLVKRKSMGYHKWTHKFGIELPKTWTRLMQLTRPLVLPFDFCRKAWLIAKGQMTKAPATLTYASITSQETLSIALLEAVLNNVGIWALVPPRCILGQISKGRPLRIVQWHGD
ncbi:hypothetical protein ACHAW6_006283 [Cyclotella cf. meneghiniana]